MSFTRTLCIFLLLAARANAQGHDMSAMQHDMPSSPGWHWMPGASLFFGFDAQEREFRDFHSWESQNWLMLDGQRRAGRGLFRVGGMASLEPLTLHDIGSAQVFQTGETFRGAPLKDYQHPHDLIMGLGSGYTVTSGTFTYSFDASLVGSPAIGPPAFMHRASAYGNPQAPLSHHYLDSTHITPGVLSAGINTSGVGIEGSWFHGREPDEDRTDIDLGKLDSYALRLSWMRGPWSAQVSGARLTLPEAITPYDADRLTGSISYTNPGRRVTAWMFAFGQNREIHGNFEAYLFEATIRASRRGLIYTRAESVDKDILDAGFHPRGVFHRHRHSQVEALTAGYLFDVAATKAGVFSLGADVTGYGVPANLRQSYGSPASYHVFVHYALISSPRPQPALHPAEHSSP